MNPVAQGHIRIRTDDTDQPTDPARGRPATASSVEAGSTHVAANAVDGSFVTRWGSEHSDPQCGA